MAVSVFDLFTIGIGPSSSHTVGPMRAAGRFLQRLEAAGKFDRTVSVEARLYGSLALTGKGHGTDVAVLMGLEGEEPETIDPSVVAERVERIRETRRLSLWGRREIDFDPGTQVKFLKREKLPYHANGMRFIARDETGEELDSREYYSVGGGFVVNDDVASEDRIVEDTTPLPLEFNSGAELLRLCQEHNLAIWQVVMENEKSWRAEQEIVDGLMAIAAAMRACVEAGCRNEGLLPGGLQVKRRAPRLFRELTSMPEAGLRDPLTVLDWIGCFAIAVNEENAAGGRVVTAPTNGAAGIMPAVLEYDRRFVNGANDQGVVRFLLTAAAIATLFKKNASISGAEVGCQGEVGVACSMAAGALCEVGGGSPIQVENAAEIGMEHNLGLTCDPVNGLVQIPCIERNAMGAVKAIKAARLALRGDGGHKVSLDKVIKTMRDTGRDMKTKYKETSRGGLAINVIEC